MDFNSLFHVKQKPQLLQDIMKKAFGENGQ